MRSITVKSKRQHKSFINETKKSTTKKQTTTEDCTNLWYSRVYPAGERYLKLSISKSFTWNLCSSRGFTWKRIHVKRHNTELQKPHPQRKAQHVKASVPQLWRRKGTLNVTGVSAPLLSPPASVGLGRRTMYKTSLHLFSRDTSQLEAIDTKHPPTNARPK